MRALISASLVVILYFATLGHGVADGSPPAPQFVQASGTSLTLAGHPLRLRGAAIYGTSNPGGPASASQVLSWAADAHLNVIRLVDVFDERGLDAAAPYDEASWAHVDQLLMDISGKGMLAVLDLSAFRNHLVNRDIVLNGWQTNCLPNSDRTPVDYGLIDPYRVGVASEWQTFIDFVAARTNTVTGVRYADDPTIAVISLAGEPQPPASEECGKATSGAELTEFYRRTLEMLRLADPNHLRSSGGLIHTDWQQIYGSDSGIDGKAIFALSDNTLPALHTYPPSYAADGTPIDYQTPALGPWAISLGKPWFTEEFGWPQDVGDSVRASRYAWLYDEQRTYQSAGALFWNLGPEVAGGSHDTNPSLPLTWNAVVAPEGSWSDAGSLIAPRFFSTVTRLPSGDVLVAGGQDGQGEIADVRLYHPGSNTWVAAAPLTIPRSRQAATVLADGTVFVTGGLTSQPGSASVVASTANYDPASGNWSAGTPMPLTRYLHTASELGDHRVLVVGGIGGPDMTGQSSFDQATAEIYDPVARIWSSVPDMGFYRFGHTATVLPNGKVLIAGGEGTAVVGGCGPNCTQELSSAELYDPTSNSWTALPDMHTARGWATATLLKTGMVLVAGGLSDYDPAIQDRVPTTTAELFDPSTNTWLPAAPMATARYEDIAGLFPDGRVVVDGGFSTRIGGIKSAEIYDPTSNSWSSAPDMSSTRWFAGATVLEDGSFLVAGGAGGPSYSYLSTSERLTLEPTSATLPSAPLAVTAVAGIGQASITWLAPASDGGSRVTSYTITASPGGASAVTNGATSATVGGLTGGTAYTFTVSATNSIGPGASSLPSAVVTPTMAPPPDPFVTARGTHLELQGQPFTFTGMNIYNANSDDWCANNMDNGKLETALSQIDLGGVHGGDHGVIRAWFFEPLATQQFSGARDWTRFDRTLAAARAAGYYVIPTLGNQWGECGHKGPTAAYKTPDWYRTGYTQLQPEDSVYATYLSYRDWVGEVVARYKDDPTIVAWQLLNEAETNPNWPQACPAGPEAFDALNGWAADMSSLVKSIDSNHLVSLGTIGSGQCGTSGAQYKALHALPNVDLCEYHDYDPWSAMPGDQYNGLALRIQQCGELNKPLFIGEVGLRPVDIGGSFESRVASLRAKLLAQRAAGIVGHLVWNWGPGLPALDSYDIGPGDFVLALLTDAPDFTNPVTTVDSDWVAPFITFTSPTRSLYTLNEPVTASWSCSEVGSAGLATCTGTRPNGSLVDTTVPGRFTFTVSTTDNLGNHRSVSNTYDVTAGDVSTTVEPGTNAIVATDPGGFGASAAVPIQTTVQFAAPAGPATPVSIDLHPATIGAPTGYAILGNEVDIDLGGLTRPAADPIVITFVVDSSTGADPSTIAISRTNADSSTDIALPCDAAPTASPDPCYVASFTAGPGSDVRVTIYATHASRWLVLRRTDPSPPVVKPTAAGMLGSNGWYRSDVAVTWTKTDPQSAILTSSGCGPTTISADTAGTTLTCSATSAGGTTSTSFTIKRDATAPDLACMPATFILGATGARVGATVSDAGSGPAAPTVFARADTSSAGRKSVQLTGLDRAGNAANTACGYVVGYSLTNLKPPSGAIVKRGTTVTIEFKLRDAAGRPIPGKAARNLVSACAVRIVFSTGNPSPNCATYDATRDTFLFALKTSKTMAPGRYGITVQVYSGADVVTTATTTIQVRS